nr:DUF3168 domain-containing protein [Ktedonobacteraceae bacterium]
MTVVQTALSEIQAAIYSKLTGDSTLTGLISGIYDIGAVPEAQAYPYVTLGDTTEVPDHAFGRRGYEDTLTLHIWSNAPGFKQCQAILAQLNRLLDQKSLTLSNHTHVGTWYEFSASLNDTDVDDLRH